MSSPTFFNNLITTETLWINIELRTPGALPSPLPTKNFNPNDSNNVSVNYLNSTSPTIGNNNAYMFFWKTANAQTPPMSGQESIGTLVVSSNGRYVGSRYPNAAPGIYAQTDNNSSTTAVTWSIVTDAIINYSNNSGRTLVINTTTSMPGTSLSLQQLPINTAQGTTILNNGSLNINLGRVGLNNNGGNPPNTRSIVAIYDPSSGGLGQIPLQATKFVNATAEVTDTASNGNLNINNTGGNSYVITTVAPPPSGNGGTSTDGGLPGWAWVLIILAIVVVVGLIIWLIWEATRKNTVQATNYTQLPGQPVYTQSGNNVVSSNSMPARSVYTQTPNNMVLPGQTVNYNQVPQYYANTIPYASNYNPN